VPLKHTPPQAISDGNVGRIGDGADQEPMVNSLRSGNTGKALNVGQ
jgi:hypothetical protein